jgi:hypothetical protein
MLEFVDAEGKKKGESRKEKRKERRDDKGQPKFSLTAFGKSRG